MLLREFYRRVILTEAALAFSREHNLLDTVLEADPCHKCGSVTQEKESIAEEEISSLCYVALERGVKLHGLFVREINFSIIWTCTTN